MKKILVVALLMLLASPVFAYQINDTIIHGSDGTAITSTGGKLDVNSTGSTSITGTITVDDTKIPNTVTGSTGSFSTTGKGFSFGSNTSKYISIYNADTSNPVLVSVTSNTVSDCNISVPPSQTLNMDFATSGIAVKSSTGSSTIYVYATYQR